MQSIIESQLEFLSLAKDYDVNFVKGEGDFTDEYCVEDKSTNLKAFYNVKDRTWEYCVTGVYNSGSDCATIDIEALGKLVRFCKKLGIHG